MHLPNRILFISLFIGMIIIISALLVRDRTDWLRTLNIPNYLPGTLVSLVIWVIGLVALGFAWYMCPEYDMLFLISIVFNLLWSLTFFGGRSPVSALMMLPFLFIVAVILLMKTYKARNMAAVVAIIVYMGWLLVSAKFTMDVINLNDPRSDRVSFNGYVNVREPDMIN